MLWPKKNSYKNSCGSKIPLPHTPHNCCTCRGPVGDVKLVCLAQISALVWRGGENLSS